MSSKLALPCKVGRVIPQAARTIAPAIAGRVVCAAASFWPRP